MSQPMFRKSTLAAALVSLGLAVGASAQSTQPSGGTAATPAPPAAGSTGMDKGAGSSVTAPQAGAATKRAKADNDKAQLPGAERRFLENAARHGIAEVELGKLAQRNAGHPQVKEFGQRMADDHGKANQELMRLASAKGVTLPTEMDKSHQRKMEQLSKKSGDEFDRDYMDEMVDDHNKDVREFRSMAKNAKDADVRAFASSTLPVLEQHLQMAKTLEDNVKQARRGGGNMQAGTGRNDDAAARSGANRGAVGSASSGMAAGSTAPGANAGANRGTPATSPDRGSTGATGSSAQGGTTTQGAPTGGSPSK